LKQTQKCHEFLEYGTGSSVTYKTKHFLDCSISRISRFFLGPVKSGSLTDGQPRV
jgi:hypothetical protein